MARTESVTAATTGPAARDARHIEAIYFKSPFVASMAMSHGATVDATPAFAMLEWLRPAPPVNVLVFVVRAP
jgi:hypothetical protein